MFCPYCGKKMKEVDDDPTFEGRISRGEAINIVKKEGELGPAEVRRPWL